MLTLYLFIYLQCWCLNKTIKFSAITQSIVMWFLKIAVFRDMTACSLLHCYQSNLPPSSGYFNALSGCMESHPRRQYIFMFATVRTSYFIILHHSCNNKRFPASVLLYNLKQSTLVSIKFRNLRYIKLKNRDVNFCSTYAEQA
jgi:hypothetical protein